MRALSWKHDRPGVALVTAILILLVIGAISTAAAVISSDAFLIDNHDRRQSLLETAAESGLEEARATINGGGQLAIDVFTQPESRPTNYEILEDGAAVTHADGSVIPGVRRSTYAGPLGAGTGQYGVFGSIVTVVEDRNGDRVVRRRDLIQRSFAEFAYFTDKELLEDGTQIVFAGGDNIEGPVHSNDNIRMGDCSGSSCPSAIFEGKLTTAGTINNRNNAIYRAEVITNADKIPMPTGDNLKSLEQRATASNMVFTAPASAAGEPRMRIEFDTIGDIGFIRVYTAAHDSLAHWVNAGRPRDYNSNGLRNSRNCGDYHGSEFRTVREHTNYEWESHLRAARSPTCYLGGSNELNNGYFVANDGRGSWKEWPGSAHTGILATRPDADYIFPFTRALNPNFEGVIFVKGSVAVSGVVRGHITVAATEDIVIVDHLTYAIKPDSNNRICTIDDDAHFDILGLFSGRRVLVADNVLNTPTRLNSPYGMTSNYSGEYVSLRSPQALDIHATILALTSFTVVNYKEWQSKSPAPACNNDPNQYASGRGCLRITGGIIQSRRGPVGQGTSTSAAGFKKDYRYDRCVLTNPPPYFPTTGVSARGGYYDIDPVGFDIDNYFSGLGS